MPRQETLLLLAVMALAACSPNKTSTPRANKAATATITGHTPLPVENVGRADLFHGYQCGIDCSLHQKGYEWGAQHKISDPKDCRGTSESFIEGCWAYAGKEGPLGEREIFQDED